MNEIDTKSAKNDQFFLIFYCVDTFKNKNFFHEIILETKIQNFDVRLIFHFNEVGINLFEFLTKKWIFFIEFILEPKSQNLNYFQNC